MSTLGEFDRGELERLRRIRECHEADRLSEREVARAVAQWGVPRLARNRWRATRGVWLAAACSLLAVGAFAASGVLRQQVFSSDVKAEATSGLSKGALDEKARGLRPQREVLPREEAPLRDVSPPTQAPTLVNSARAGALSAPRSARALEVVSAESASDGAGRAWAEAAAALRRGDQPAAQRALGELSRSDDAATRDAALLAQAELDLGTGDEARARAVLSELAARGATSFLQKRAQQILSDKK